MSKLSQKLLAPLFPFGSFRFQKGRTAGLFALICALALATAGFGGNAQPPLQSAEPDMVGPVTNLAVSVVGQAEGSVRLTWSQAEDAQVHFVVYAKSDEVNAGNLRQRADRAIRRDRGGGQTVWKVAHPTVSSSSGCAGTGWITERFGAAWSQWSSATPAGSAWLSRQPAMRQATEPDMVGQVTNLTASVEGQEPRVGPAHLVGKPRTPRCISWYTPNRTK